MKKEFKHNGKKIKVEIFHDHQNIGAIDTAEKHLILGFIDGSEKIRRVVSDLQITLMPGIIEKELRKMSKPKITLQISAKQIRKLSDNGYK